MKLITAFIALMTFHFTAVSQNSDVSSSMVTTRETVSGTLAFSDNTGAMEYAAGLPVKCREITITSLPPVTQSVTALNLDFGMVGTFTIKIDPSLEIYDSRDVYIEDALTGKIFDLKTSGSYSFNVNRRIPERFVLHIDKMILKYALSSNGR